MKNQNHMFPSDSFGTGRRSGASVQQALPSYYNVCRIWSTEPSRSNACSQINLTWSLFCIKRILHQGVVQ